MANRTWYSVKAAAGNDPAELMIYDEIGMFGVTASQFATDFKALGAIKQLTLRINSPGGDVFAGNAIFNILDRAKGRGLVINVVIDGLAASMASLIAMVGTTVAMPENAMMMIHNPSGGVFGTSEDMKQWAAFLDKLKATMVATYAKKSGMDADDVATLMDEETWLTAEEAVTQGFADLVEKPHALAATYDLHRYKHPPESYGGQPADVSASKEPESMANSETPAAPDVAALTATAEARANTRATAIVNACTGFGYPEKIAGYLPSAKTSDEVLAELAALGPKPAPVAAVVPPVAAAVPPAPPAPPANAAAVLPANTAVTNAEIADLLPKAGWQDEAIASYNHVPARGAARR